jgi:hypothetical protein
MKGGKTKRKREKEYRWLDLYTSCRVKEDKRKESVVSIYISV